MNHEPKLHRLQLDSGPRSATFGLLALYELLHGAMSLSLARRYSHADHDGSNIFVSIWFLLCPLAALVCVYIGISLQNVAAQYAAVGLQFAYFLPLSPSLGRS